MYHGAMESNVDASIEDLINTNRDIKQHYDKCSDKLQKRQKIKMLHKTNIKNVKVELNENIEDYQNFSDSQRTIGLDLSKNRKNDNRYYYFNIYIYDKRSSSNIYLYILVLG